MQLPNEPTRDFPYHVEEKIGEGSMGLVYRARETNLDRQAAIKVLRPEVLDELTDEAARKLSRRFLQEARASAKVNHPGVVTVHRLGAVRGQSFIAMEWLDGDDLRAKISQEAPLPLEEARRIAGDLLDTLDAAHGGDIVHRDIKPSNVMLAPGSRVVLTDFGIAQVRNSELVKTQAGSILGTPVYASPEQLLDDPVDRRSDLYSVGVVLFEMLTGELPHDGTSVASLVAKRLDEDPPTPSSINPSVPEDLDALVGRALQRRPDNRFESAESMLGALETGVVPDEESNEIGQQPSQPAESAGTDDGDEPPVCIFKGSSALALAVRAARNWPADPIGKRDTDELLDKLLETPLHADPFAGAVQLDKTIVFIHQGLVYAGIDLETGDVGDAVLERLEATAPATLFPVPDHLDNRIVPHLASLLHRPHRVHEGLDSSYTDLPELVDRLCEEHFDGVVRFESDGELGFVVIDRGERLVDLFSAGWNPSPADRSWRDWIGDRPVRAHVEKRRTALPSVTYRRELRDLSLDVTPASEGQEIDPKSSGSHAGLRHSTWIVRPRKPDDGVDGRDSTIWRDLYKSDPHYKLLNWLLEGLPEYLEERGRFQNWKYLSTWVEDISEARLYHDLPRPNQRASDTFGLVTMNPEQKVLHVARRRKRIGADDLEAFVDDVKGAKKARIDRGDVGGALLVASDFREETDPRYRELTANEGSSWFFDLQDSMTGYEGFVRIGSRRGFHLMLVEETDEGFEPLLPPAE